MNIRCGFCVPIFAAPGQWSFRTPNYDALDVPEPLAMAVEADALGYNSLWIADHLQLGEDQAIMEGWTTMAALAGMTSRAQLGLIHGANLLRHAAVTARAAMTLDQISNGRLIYFLAPNAGEIEQRAYGVDWPEPEQERVAQMVEALEMSVALWTAESPIDYEGKFYRLNAATCNPPPVQKPHPPIWIDASRPDMYAACARFAQGWNATPIGLESLDERLAGLQAACDEIGRAFDEIELSYETQILIAPDKGGVRALLQQLVDKGSGEDMREDMRAFLSGDSDVVPEELAKTFLIGTPDEVAAQMQVYIDRGISHFMLWFMDAPERGGLRLFAEEVLPRFR